MVGIFGAKGCSSCGCLLICKWRSLLGLCVNQTLLCGRTKHRKRKLNLASSNEEKYRMQSEVSHFEHVDFHNSPNFQLWSFLSDARRWCNVPFDVLRFRESRSTAQTERRISNRARLCGFERQFWQRLFHAGLCLMIYCSASKSLATLQAAHRMTELSVGIL